MTSNFADFEADLNQDKNLTADYTDDRYDCFELLSAYIDGELSLAEKQQVQTWLDEDPQVKAIYIQLMSLQSQMQHSIAPPSGKSVAEITAGVLETIDCDRRRTRQHKLVWGGAIAASFVALFSGIVPGLNTSSLQMAHTKSSDNSSVMLAVAVNKPAIHIPKGIEGYHFNYQPEQN